LENLQKTSKKTPALVWLFAYKSKIAKKKYFDIEVKTTISSKKIPPKKFCRLCKEKNKCVSPLQKKLLDLYKKIIEKLKKSICPPPHFLSKI